MRTKITLDRNTPIQAPAWLGVAAELLILLAPAMGVVAADAVVADAEAGVAGDDLWAFGESFEPRNLNLW
jgi:hypothetical protein